MQQETHLQFFFALFIYLFKSDIGIFVSTFEDVGSCSGLVTSSLSQLLVTIWPLSEL